MKRIYAFLPIILLGVASTTSLTAGELLPLAAFTDASLVKFLGRMHVLVLHFPIAILLLAFFSSFLRLCRIRLFDDKSQLALLLFGSVSALVAVAFGLILAQEDDPTDAIRWHMYTGIGAFVCSLICVFSFKVGLIKSSSGYSAVYACSALMCTSLLFWSGHLGGELSHGKKFFSEYAPWTEPRKPKQDKTIDLSSDDVAHVNSNAAHAAHAAKVASADSANGTEQQATDGQSTNAQNQVANTNGAPENPEQQTDSMMTAAGVDPMANVAQAADAAGSAQKTVVLSKAAKENAALFIEHVEPILAARCYECHGASKQKSDLRLDSPEFIRIGGNGGEVVVSGQPERSSMYTLAVLDEDDPDIMPPKGKPLSKKQLEIIHKWIVGGAFYGDEAQRQQAPKQKVDTRVSKLEKESAGISKPSEKVLKSIRSTGVHVNSLTSNGALLELDMRFHKQPLSHYPELLKDIRLNIRWLDIGRTQANDQVMMELAKFPKLQRLYVHETKITDAGLAHIAKLKDLEVLNLYKCSISDAGLKHLHKLSKLKKIYVWQSKVTANGIKALQQALPTLDINNGR